MSAGASHSGWTQCRSARVAFATALVVVAGGTTVAFAADPRPDNARGAVVTVAPSEVALGGKVVFTGTGFASGEAVCIKIDDGNIANVSKGEADTFGKITAAPDGTLQGTVDLAKVSPETPVGPGAHWLRFLSGPGTCIEGVNNTARSLHSNFTVAAPAPTPTPVPTPTLAPGQTPPPATPVPTPTPVPPPERVVGGTAVVVITSLKLAKKSTVELQLKAGARGSAGKVRIVTKKKFKIGKAKKKQQVIFKSDSYLVEPTSTLKLKLTLTSEGKALFKTKKAIDGIVELRDASGDSDVDQPVVIKR